MSFQNYAIEPRCLALLKAQGLVEPTAVQEQAIPVALEGRDVTAVAQTGTGKTLAFCLPALTRLAAEPKVRGTRMLVVTPTRELAVQVHRVFEPFARKLGLRATCVFGGVGMAPQTQDLRQGAAIVIATPGRLLDHINRGNARFDNLSVLVLDEADRMLDMGFLPDIKRIVNELPKERQTMLFSATFPKDIQRLAADFQNDPCRIEVGPMSTPTDSVRQGVYTVDSSGKMNLLSDLLGRPGVDSAIVFIRTKHRTDRVAKTLSGQGFKAQAIHGGRSQAQRQRALDGFRRGSVTILVATDVAARGIDVKGVTHVVNFDVPGCFDDYVHRIGRTARANATGDAITFISPEDYQELGDIEAGLGKPLHREPWAGEVHVRSVNRTSQGPSQKRGHAKGGYQGQNRSQSKRPRRFAGTR
jgi:ATP-dependent RNA helicase RhlE